MADLRLLNQKSDTFTMQLLVGADSFWSCINTRKSPARVLSSYLLESLWGDCIVGKIPGSTRLADPKTVTPLSIMHMAFSSMPGSVSAPLPSSSVPLAQTQPFGFLSDDETLDSFNAEEVITDISSFANIGINLYDRD